MDWKEAAKWFGLIVVAGVAGEAVWLIISGQLKATAATVARAEARTEVDRVITAAVQQLNARPQAMVADAPPKPQSNGYVYQL